MKTLFTRKIIITIAIFPIVGYTSQNINISANYKIEKEKSLWENIKKEEKKINKSTKKSKKECDDCYADISKQKENTHDYDFKLTSSDTYEKSLDEKKSYTKVYNSVSQRAKSKTKNKDSFSEIAIQVGAFRRYVGAKLYAKKYNLLSNKYGVKIETGVKNQKPLYRVKIEGFTTKSEAVEFKDNYSLTGAFIVLK